MVNVLAGTWCPGGAALCCCHCLRAGLRASLREAWEHGRSDSRCAMHCREVAVMPHANMLCQCGPASCITSSLGLTHAQETAKRKASCVLMLP